mgnify:CR=1 FL=1
MERRRRILHAEQHDLERHVHTDPCGTRRRHVDPCLLYTSDAADERSSVDLGGRRIIKKKKIEAGDMQTRTAAAAQHSDQLDS